MAVIIIPSRRTRQPQGPVQINWASPFAAGLLRVYSGIPGWRESIYGATGAVTGTPATIATADGLAWNLTSSNYLAFDDNYRTSIADKLTVAWLGTIPSLASNNSIFGNMQSSDPVRNWMLFNATGPKLSFYVTNTGGTSVPAIAATNSSVGRHALVGTYDGANVYFYEDSRAPVSAAQTGNVKSTDYETYFSRWNFSGLAAYHNFALIANRTWSDAEVADWRAYPWQIFAPDVRRIYFGAGGGTTTVDGTATITPAAQTLTSTGGTVAVGATATISPAAQTVTSTGGTVAVAGTATISPAVQTVTASGDVVSGIVGTASITPAAQTLTSTGGTVAVGATATITPSAQTLTGAATVSGGTCTGTANITVSAQTLVASCQIIVAGTATITPSAQTLTGREAGFSIWTDVAVSASTWSDVGGATSIWTDL